MAAQELVDYVRARRKDGYTDDSIRTVLLNSGYDKATVEDAVRGAVSMSSMPPPPSVPPTTPSSGSGLMNASELPKIPFGVKFIAVLYFIGGGIVFIGALFGLLTGIQGYQTAIEKTSAVFVIILCFVGFYSLWDLLHGKNWARWFLVVSGLFELIYMGLTSFLRGAVSLSLAVFFSELYLAFVAIYLIFRSKVKNVYQAAPAQKGMPWKLIVFSTIAIAIQLFFARGLVIPSQATQTSSNLNSFASSTQQNNSVATVASSSTISSAFAFTSPVGGEQWAQGSTQTISWSGVANYDNMNLSLDITDKTLGADFQYERISGNPIDQKSGSITWNIPYSIKPGQYKVAACFSNNLGGGSTTACHIVSSGVITITAGSSKPTITLDTFKNGDTLVKGKTYTLTWSTNFSTQGKSVLIDLLRGTLQSQSVDSQITAIRGPTNMNDPLPQQNGGIKWTVPTSIPNGNNYGILVMIGADSQHPYGEAELYVYPLTITN